MSMEVYAKKLEEYLEGKSSNKSELEAAKGLLAPRTTRNGSPQATESLDAVATVGDFIYAIRMKKKETLSKLGKKKNGA